MKIDEQLNQVFNLNPDEVATQVQIFEPQEVTVIEEIEEDDDDGNVEKDFKEARKVIKNLIKTNDLAIEQIGKIAITYENPRGFEVLCQLIKAQANLVKELMESHKKKQDLMPKKDLPPQQIENQNNIVFTGTASDLMKAISKKNE